MLMGAFRIMDRRMTDLAAMSTRFSPEAQRGVMQTKMLELRREQFMANTFGIDVAGAERSKREGIQRRAQADVSGGAGQISFFESLKQDAMSFGNELLGSAAQGISDPEEFLKPSSIGKRFEGLKQYMPFLDSQMLDQSGRVDVGKLGTMGQEMTAGMSDNKARDVQVKNEIIDAENLRLMREQNRLLKGGS